MKGPDLLTIATDTPFVFFLIIASMVFSAILLMQTSDRNRTLGELPKGRFKSLEGLRGLLAVSVFSGHCVISLGYSHTAQWESPKYVLYSWATKGAVALFFMITGLLFWTKVLDSGCYYKSHCTSRFRRIYPLYLLMASMVLLVVAVEGGLGLNIPALQFLTQLFFWLLPGIVAIDSINSVTILFINAGVLWTLQYEWGFYLILPVIALLFRHRTWAMAVLYLMIFLGAYASNLTVVTTHMKVALPLLLGCLSAHILRSGFWRTRRQSLPYQWFTLLLVAASIMLYLPGASTLNNVLFLWPAFTLVAGGVSVFGFLHSRPMVYLGRISFGVYLLHGIFLYMLRAMLSYSDLGQVQQDLIFIGSLVPSALALTWFCTWAHVFVELPFMKKQSVI